jgi:hypothetical protein
VKEMRLRGRESIKDANAFLEKYLPRYNRRFSRNAAEAGNLHRAVPKGLNPDKILCIRTERTVRTDFTIAHDRKLYQIQEGVTARKVTVEEYVNGSTAILCRGLKVKFREITTRPEKPRKEPSKPPQRKALPPPKDHPWRRFHFVNEKHQSRAA